MLDFPRLCYVNESLRWLVQHVGPLRTQIETNPLDTIFWNMSIKATLSGATEIKPIKINSATYFAYDVDETDENEEQKEKSSAARAFSFGALSDVMLSIPAPGQSSATPKKPLADSGNAVKGATPPLSPAEVRDIPK